MRRDEFLARFPAASESTIRKNCPDDSGKVAVVERGFKHGREGQDSTQTQTARRTLVRIISVRKRLLDEDGICEKFLVDGLRYAGLLDQDSPDKTHIETHQRKCRDDESEHTEITIERIP